MNKQQAIESLTAKQNQNILKLGWAYELITEVIHAPTESEPWESGRTTLLRRRNTYTQPVTIACRDWNQNITAGSTETITTAIFQLACDIERVKAVHEEHCHDLQTLSLAAVPEQLGQNLWTIWKSSRCSNHDLIVLALRLQAALLSAEK